MKLKAFLVAAIGFWMAGAVVAGDLAMSAYWQDHMVLQRGKRITVWGKDAAGRTVTVSFAGQTATAVTGSDGFWQTDFAQPFALSSTPQTLTVADNAGETLTRSDILVGDVYLAGGQSNMDRFLSYKTVFQEPQSVKDFCKDDDGIRFIRIAKTSEKGGTGEELFDLPVIKEADADHQYYGDGHDWAVAAGGEQYYVSSVALNFAHYIRAAAAAKGQSIPIGIVHASVGGSYIRNWLSRATLTANNLSYVSGDGWYWDEMIAPLLRAKFRGILWYQGCSDAEKQPAEYKQLMDILVSDWRGRWGENGDLPFYAVQIGTPGCSVANNVINLDQYPAPTESSAGSNYVRVREGQRLWDNSDTGTHGLVTIVDCVKCLGEGDLHPNDKNFVGRRLSVLARRDLYEEPELTAEGPVFTRAVREADGAVRIHFKSGTARGLTAARMKPATEIALSRWVKSADAIRGFAVCGADNVWQDAVATVEGETIVLRAEGVANPTKFHYGYWCITRSTELEDGQRLNLYNASELPMSPVAPQTIEDPTSGLKVADPVLLPASCFFSPSTNVTISCATPGATIRYTLDGSEPTASSAVYTGPISIDATTTVRARAFVADKEASDVVFSTYTLGEAEVVVSTPEWTPGSYEPSEWRPLGTNLLATAQVSLVGSVSYICDGNLSKLSDGQIPVTITGDAGAKSQKEVVGFGENSGAVWTFAKPVSIGKIRISSRWINTSYDGITVNDVLVLKDGEWISLNTPVSHLSGTSKTTGALEATLANDGQGYLAQNVSALKILFGKPESAVANYYAEVEAIASGDDVPAVDPGPSNPVTPVAGSLVVDMTISDHCVLQRGAVNKVKGTATAGATVTVSFGGVTASAVADANGDFLVSFNPGAANATGRNLVVSDTVNTVTIADVLVGDVFYLSGQSNVRFQVADYNKSEALADCSYPAFRMMVLPSANSGRIAESDKNLPCSWDVCSSTACTNMSSFGFFLGRELIKSKNVPIGIVSAAVKGTYISNWLPNGECDKYMACRADHIAVKGAIWYQGESDALNYSDRTYPQKLRNLIQYWRTNRGNANLPVVVVQLPRYRDTYRNCGDTEKINCWGIFRVDQDLALADVDNAVCVPTLDYGAEYNIHPSDKPQMGARIALAVRSLMYGDNVSYRCPYPTSAVKSADGSSVTVSFPASTTLSFATDNASTSFGEEKEMFSIGGVNVMPTISADGHSLVFSGSFANATQADYALCGFPQILVRDANGFPMPPFSITLGSGEGSGEVVPADPTLYSVTVTAPQNGTLTTSATSPVAAGTVVTVTATPAEGYELESVTVNGTAITGNTFTMPAANVTVAATFKRTAASGGEGEGEGSLEWTTGSCAPADWQALANNALLNVTGSSTAAGVSAYASTDLAVLTDGVVPTSTPDKPGIYGFKNGDTISWSFAEAKTLDRIRISSCYLTGAAYDGLHLSKVEVQTSAGGAWTELAGEVEYKGESAAGKINYAVLSKGSSAVAQGVYGLRITFGTCETGFANYYAEIEAVERTSSGTEEPTLYSVTITAPQNGTLETSVTNNVAAGTVVTVTATPAEGYELEAVTVNGTAITGNTFSMPAANVTVAATFKQTASGEEGDGSDVVAPAEWTLGDVAPAEWSPIQDNLLAGKTGIVSGSLSGYASTDLSVLTDGTVPTAAGKDPIVGPQSGTFLTWELDAPKTITSLRISTCYLGGPSYSPGTVSEVAFKDGATGEWTALAVSAVSTTGTSGNILYAVLGPSSAGNCIATNVTGIRLTFGNPPLGFASYCAEIEASGHDASASGGKSYPEWIDATDSSVTASYDAWASANGVTDTTAAIKDAYLLNCANNATAVEDAKEAFKITGITITDGAISFTTTEGGYNGKVEILGCETVNGTYHTKQAGDRFFKAVLVP